jgi:polyisoprenoid-binding protein YceI
VTSAGVSVVVETPDGWPVAGAILTLTDLSGQQAGLALTNDQGQARLSELRPGPYTVIFSAPGFSPMAMATVVAEGHTTPIGTVRLERIGKNLTLPEPGVWTLDPVHSGITATARHAGISAVRGRFTSFGATVNIADPVERSSLSVTIDADSIDTGNKMRDDHLRSADFLDVENSPVIRYEGAGLAPAGPDRWTLHGELTVRGEVRPVDLDLRYLGTDVDPFGFTRAGFQATTQLRREDFRISWSQNLATGIAMVGSKVRLDIDVELVQGESLPQL